jgi:hypothetical protein
LAFGHSFGDAGQKSGCGKSRWTYLLPALSIAGASIAALLDWGKQSQKETG